MAEVVHSIRSSGGDYASLTDWQDAQKSVIAAGDTAVAECYNDWPTGLVDSLVISGWTAGNIIIRAAAGHSHDGIPGAGFFLKKSAGFAGIIDIQNNNVTLQNIEIENTHSAGRCVVTNQFSNVLIEGCIGKSPDSAFFNLGSFTTLRKCWAYESGAGFSILNWTGPVLQNCGASDCTTGVAGSANGPGATLQNCVAYNNTTNYLAGAAGFNGSNNAASDATTNTPPGTSPLLTDIVSGDFVDATNNDFHLASGSSLDGAGVDLSADFTTDIDGDTISTPWPIGFDYIVASGTDVTGSGAGQAQNATGSGTGSSVVVNAGIAALSGQNALFSSTGVVTENFTGTAQLDSLQAIFNGTGTVVGTISGAGAGQAQNATGTGTGTITIPVTGLAGFNSETALFSGSGIVLPFITGLAAFDSQTALFSGSGTALGAVVGSGAGQAQNATGAGTGITAVPVTGTASWNSQIADFMAAGITLAPVTGSGAGQAQNSTASGVGGLFDQIVGVGAAQAQHSTAAGTGHVFITQFTGLLSADSQNAGFDVDGSVYIKPIGFGRAVNNYSTMQGTGQVCWRANWAERVPDKPVWSERSNCECK